MTELLLLCTGNAARSVMAGFMLERLAEGRAHSGPPFATPLHIVTAGTHTVDGQPMGLRTRSALLSIPELADVELRRHRSRQVMTEDFVRAELVVAMEADHVRFVRRQFPEASERTATIRRLCTDLTPPPPSLGERVAALRLADAVLRPEDDIVDPAGGDETAYVACAAELWRFCRQLIMLV